MENLCHDTDFFATGDSYMREVLNFNFIPRVSNDKQNVSGGGGILTSDSDLQHNYLTAENVFKSTEQGKIKFVLIGLSPYLSSENNSSPLTVWDVKENLPILENYIKLCLDNGAKPVGIALPVDWNLRRTYNAEVLKLFRDTLNSLVKNHKSRFSFIDLLESRLDGKFFQDKSHLNSEGAAAISALLGAKLYPQKVVSLESILNMDNDFFSVLSKYFPADYKTLMHNIFCKLACNDFKRLSETLPKENCLDLMAQVFSVMTYDHLVKLSDMLPKDEYNDLAERIFKISVEKIRRKDKIKVGFCFDYSAAWCGDDVYNFFARDNRFEPTIFFRSKGNFLTREKEFTPDLERFKTHGLNVAEVEYTSDIPTQDILIKLTPYQYEPATFHLYNLHVETLMAYIPYGATITNHVEFINSSFFRALWKMFFPSRITLELYREKSKVGMPRAVYSGYPKLDVFFKSDSKFHFDWKMTRPDAKKIIWAPHHTIDGEFSTFRWNYQFMYEFAKVHPEISWIVKPHPNLINMAITKKLFPSLQAFKEYLQKWDDLPNAQVYTGAYYQAIFATSDGMIQDCSSFIVEYQYVDKPMIYLTTGKERLNDLSKEVLKASYCLDGKDLDAIAALIQRVFIEGDDYKAADRKVVFDKHLNYFKDNGMLASEFIYKNIVDELRLPPR